MNRLVEIDFHPGVKTLRQFGAIAFVGFGALAALAHYEKLIFAFGLGDAKSTVVSGFVVLAALALLSSWVAPRANRWLYLGLTVLAFPIGYVLSYVVMGALFYLVIGPIAVLFRLSGRDLLSRCYDPTASSYWQPIKRARDKDSYFHQY